MEKDARLDESRMRVATSDGSQRSGAPAGPLTLVYFTVL